MFVLQEKIGEAQVNLALKRFVKDWNAFDANFNKERYATSKDLLQYFDAVTPDSLKATVFELFETVTTYDVAIKSAVVDPKSEDEFTLNLELQLEKWQNNANGVAEAKTPNTVVMLTIYGLDADNNEVVLEELEVQMNSKSLEMAITYKTKPSKVVLDSKYLLLDINRENNTKKI
jgi:hypothetical protein